MKKFLIIAGIVLALCIAQVATAAPTSTYVQNLFITGLNGSATPCLQLSSNNLVTAANNPCGSGSGGGGSSTTFNGITTSTLSIRPGAGATVSTSTDASGQAIITIGATGNGSSTVITCGSGLTCTPTNPITTTGTITLVTSGNWTGTWQGVNSTTFYLASNPNGYTSNAGTLASTTAWASGNIAIVSSSNFLASITTSTLLIELGASTSTGIASYNVTCASGCSVSTTTTSAAITVTGGGSGSSTNVFGTKGVMVIQTGANATASIDEAFGNSWTVPQNFTGILNVGNVTTTNETVSSTLALTNVTPSGTLIYPVSVDSSGFLDIGPIIGNTPTSGATSTQEFNIVEQNCPSNVSTSNQSECDWSMSTLYPDGTRTFDDLNQESYPGFNGTGWFETATGASSTADAFLYPYDVEMSNQGAGTTIAHHLLFQITPVNATGTWLGAVFLQNGNGTINGNEQINGLLQASSTGTETIRIVRGNNSSYGLLVFDTNGTDDWNFGENNNSTNNFVIQDATNGGTIIQAIQNGTTTVGVSGTGKSVVVGPALVASTSLQVLNTTSSLGLFSSNGTLGPYGGTACFGSQALQTLGVNGGGSCITFGSSNLASTTNWASGNIAVVSSSNLLASFPASSTAVIYVDGNRTDSYTANGSFLFPQKTVSAAITQCNALATAGFTGCAFILSPDIYVDGAPDTFPNVPFYISGNESTLVEPSGVTMPNSFDIFDLTIVGNVTEADTSTVVIHQFNNGAIVGNLSLAGNATLQGMAMPQTTSTLTVQKGALTNINSSFLQGNIIDAGTININDDEQLYTATNTTGYAIYASSTGSIVNVDGFTDIVTSPLTDSIYVSNGATSTPNNLTTFSIVVNTSTAGSTITAGTAATTVSNVTSLSNMIGQFIAPTGTAFVASYNEMAAILNAFSVGTSTATSGDTILNNNVFLPLLSNTILGVNGSGQIVATTTSGGGGSGNGNVVASPSSSISQYSTPYYLTAASTTVSVTSTLRQFPDGDATINSSTDNGVFDIVNASGTHVLTAVSSTNNNLALLLGAGLGFSTSSVTVSSCGTGSPTVLGSNNVFAMVTGSSASSCTLNFTTSTAAGGYWKNTPVCFVSDSNTTAVVDVSSISTSSVTFSIASALSAVNIYGLCIGNPG